MRAAPGAPRHPPPSNFNGGGAQPVSLAGVRQPVGRERRSSRRDFYDLVTQLERERAFQDIPRLVVLVMHMQGRNGTRGAGRRARVRPLGDDELCLSGTDSPPGQWGHNDLVEAPFLRAR